MTNVREESLPPARTEFADGHGLAIQDSRLFVDILDHHAEFTVAMSEQRTVVDVGTAADGHPIVNDHQFRVDVNDFSDLSEREWKSQGSSQRIAYQTTHENVMRAHTEETEVISRRNT